MINAAPASARAQQGLSIREALLVCEQHGNPMTGPGLRYIGHKYGIMTRTADGKHWQVNRPKLLGYLKSGARAVPEGWLPVSACARVVDVTVDALYKRIRRAHLQPKRFGPGKGVMHLELHRVIAIYSQHKEGPNG